MHPNGRMGSLVRPDAPTEFQDRQTGLGPTGVGQLPSYPDSLERFINPGGYSGPKSSFDSEPFSGSAVSQDYESGRLLLHVEHRRPDSGPSAILIAEHPQIPAACAISFTRTLVDHVVSKGNDSCIGNDISFVIVILKFMNSGVLTKISKAGEKLFPTLDPPGEARKYHDYVRVDHRYESFHIPIEPGTVDSLHC
jgi:hypothetical protein